MRRVPIGMALVLLSASPALAVDGVLEINQVCADKTGCFSGDAAGFPVTIGTAGSYRLTGNLDSAVTTIEVNADRVTLDLNGFEVRCAFCRPILSTNSFVSVGNGIVEGTGPTSSLSLTGSGSEVSSVRVVQGQLILGDSCRVTDSQVSFNFQTVTVGDDCKVLRNRISGTGSSSSIDAGDRALIEDNHITSSDAGISAGAGALIRGNSVSATQGGIFSSSATVTDNVVDGIGFANTVGIGCDECVVEKNVVSDWGSFGLSDSSGATAYKGNHFDNNNGGNANPQVSGGLETGANVCGGNTTCP